MKRVFPVTAPRIPGVESQLCLPSLSSSIRIFRALLIVSTPLGNFGDGSLRAYDPRDCRLVEKKSGLPVINPEQMHRTIYSSICALRQQPGNPERSSLLQICTTSTVAQSCTQLCMQSYHPMFSPDLPRIYMPWMLDR